MQDGWRWCRRCQGLAHSALGNGVCFDEQGHDFSESSYYAVPVGDLTEGAQQGWRWCKRCQGLCTAASVTVLASTAAITTSQRAAITACY